MYAQRKFQKSNFRDLSFKTHALLWKIEIFKGCKIYFLDSLTPRLKNLLINAKDKAILLLVDQFSNIAKKPLPQDQDMDLAVIELYAW